MADRRDPPRGTVTFLLTDIEGSTRRWETAPEAMEVALDRHNRILTEVIEQHGGVVVVSRGEGDSMFAAFPSAVDAVQAAGECQLRLHREPWPAGAVLRVRMGLHTGEAHTLDGDYVDHAPINRCSRVKAVAVGGQVLVTRATADLVAGRLSGGFALSKLGEYRLRDLLQPELIFQLDHPELPSDFPPIRTPAQQLGNLPLQLASFVGRRAEVELIDDALDRTRLVTLTGPGGVGKTRLALEVAGRRSSTYRDGVWLIELAAVRDADLVEESVAAVFSVSAVGGPSLREVLADFLRDKQALLVLDNCEHVLAQAGALAGSLVRSCENLVILATSREGLAIEGEQVIPIPPLPVPDPQADPESISKVAAVRLFVERAAAVRAGFTLTAANAETVGDIVRRLDGVALAIELAAARTPAMTPAELARRLRRSLAVLATGRRDVGDRHQTLRATIDWSFALLSGPEQELLCRMAVFAGDCALGAVESVCGADGIEPDEVLDLVSGLVSKSLVVAEEHGMQTRYRLLETIRRYGEDRLGERGETGRWRGRHADYYADLFSRIREPDELDDRFWAVRLGEEQDNLLAAWSWAIDDANVSVAFRILAGFAPSEVSSTYPLMLPDDEARGLPGAEADEGYPLALAVSAVFASNRVDPEHAEELCRQAVAANAAARRPDWRVEQAVCTARANITTIQQAFSEAAHYHEQSAALARKGGDLADTSVELAHAVASYTLADDAASGVPLAHEALELARQIGAPALIATALLEVGAVLAVSDPPQARECLRESRELSDALGYHKARDLVWAAGIAFLLNDRTATLELAISAVVSLQRTGNRLLMGITVQLIAGMLAAASPEVAAIIMGAAEARVIESSRIALLVGAAVAQALGEEQIDPLRARGAAMDWDAAVALALAEAVRALEGADAGA